MPSRKWKRVGSISLNILFSECTDVAEHGFSLSNIAMRNYNLYNITNCIDITVRLYYNVITGNDIYFISAPAQFNIVRGEEPS